MNAILPAFVSRLLQQGHEPGKVPDISQQATTGWLGPLASRILNGFDTRSHQAAGSFSAYGYCHLPIPVADGQCAYLRLRKEFGWHSWPVLTTSVVLTMAGTVGLEVYQEVAGALAGQPQYVRSFGPEEVFAVHPGTHCSTRSESDNLQVLVTEQPLQAGRSPLSGDEYRAVAGEARRVLERLSLAATAGGLQ
ncbi:hypothetical protein ACIPSA_43060 [Streptomyces sp. NPDC086549]|uniref:hypothetical protein n=1 Tax=Streptomyces sp. NPDC086549 TaxID=3365752 RepID=UPI0038068F44